MTVLSSSLINVHYYKLIVYTNTFKSLVSSTEYVFFASCSPSIGNCVVTPTHGKLAVKINDDSDDYDNDDDNGNDDLSWAIYRTSLIGISTWTFSAPKIKSQIWGNL